MFENGLRAINRAASRYTHGSRRLKRGAAWKPPSLHDFRSIPDLRQYGDPDRIIGSDFVNQQTAGGTYCEVSIPEVISVKSKPAPIKQPTVQQPRPEQPSRTMTLRNAFRALLWPIRAHPLDRDHECLEEDDEDTMSQFVASETGQASPSNHDGRPVEHAISPGPYSPSPGQLTIQYYHVDSAENKTYQQWVNLLGPSMGGAWVPMNQPGHKIARIPSVPELDSYSILAELPADSYQAAELLADSQI